MERQSEESFFITDQVKARQPAAGYLFDQWLIACTARLRDVQGGMIDAELELQSDKIADQERERRKNKLLP
ncbi:hypothetical protein [Pseudomonas syringae]|uniref:hypothetical protein n=1 Tax=Pseudomonas syringae TaxID=317 RepID=UPI0004266DBD